MKHRRWLAAAAAGLLLCGALAEGADAPNLSSDSVYRLELRLAELGYFAGESDGTFDGDTRAALERFQQGNGLEVTGSLDDATLERVNGDDAVSRQAFLEAYAQRAAEGETLRQGDSGAAVKEVQTRLKALGFFSDRADGAFGEATLQAVERFQQANGLEQSGEVDGATRMRLLAEAPITWGGYLAEMSCAPGDSGLSVYALQKLLEQMGYFGGGCTANYGELTQRAVERFQAANDLEVTGAADAATWEVLLGDGAVVLRRWDELQRGDSGERVRAVADRLFELGYLAHEGGSEYDFAVETAVRLFQLGNGLDPSGTLDGDVEDELLSENALAVDSETVQQAWQTLLDGVEGDTHGYMADAAQALLGTAFYTDDDLYPGFAFVQCVAASAGVPVLHPETLTALAASRVTDPSQVARGDIVAFQSASRDSVSIQLAVGAGDGKIYYTTADGGWVVLGFINQMDSTNIYRWGAADGGGE